VKEFLAFLFSVADELYEIFVYTKQVASDPSAALDAEHEKQLAMRLIRKASDAQMRRELSGK
jgi:hypothetical protein